MESVPRNGAYFRPLSRLLCFDRALQSGDSGIRVYGPGQCGEASDDVKEPRSDGSSKPCETNTAPAGSPVTSDLAVNQFRIRAPGSRWMNNGFDVERSE